MKRARSKTEIESPGEVLLKFKDELKLVLTPSRSAKRVRISDIKAKLCCQPYGMLNYMHLLKSLEVATLHKS